MEEMNQLEGQLQIAAAHMFVWNGMAGKYYANWCCFNAVSVILIWHTIV